MRSMPESQKPVKIWINAGEISGDLHGASLVKALKESDPGLSLMGMGGPQMRESGFESFFQVEQLSVMGFTEVLAHIPAILRLLKDIEHKMAEEKPDAVVVIDAPDFHFRVIKAARRLGIPVYYYISPKLWAWRQGRARFIKQNVRRLLSILPFEVEFYQKFGMSVDYVGNPIMDALNLTELDKLEPVLGRVGFMPGSRRKEVSSLMPEFGKAARIMRESMPELSFACAVAPGMDEAFLKSFWPDDVPLEFRPPAERYVFMRRCEMLISASGTAVLESALIGTPTLITYKVSPLTFSLGKRLVKISFVGLPNLIAGREILPELLQEEADGPNLAKRALEWLRPEGPGAGGASTDIQDRLGAVRGDLAELRKLVGGPGAAGRAAGVILSDLNGIMRGQVKQD